MNDRRLLSSFNKLRRKQMNTLKNFLTDETGAELAEYAVAVALLVAIALIIYTTLGKGINDANSTTGSKIKEAGPINLS